MACRPRHSVLSLFDPLAATDAPSTPPRDSVSPDSDKENSSPPLTLSAFFGRTYKQQQQQQQPCPTVALPRKRLVDVGDTTLEDISALDLLADGQEQPSRNEPNADSGVLLQPRTPFAELTLRDIDSTPLARTRGHPYQPSAPSLLSQLMSDDELAPGPDDSPTHGMADKVIGDAGSTTVQASEIYAPEIVVSACHPDKLVGDDFQSDMTRDVVLPSFSSPEPVHEGPSLQGITHSSLRLHPPTTAPYSNRVSIDLQASFQLHFQSDTSFDLLNDKISLIEPMECLTTDDENFDFEVEKEKLRDALTKFRKGLTPSKTSALHDGLDNRESLSQEDSNSAQASKQSACDDIPAPPKDRYQPLPYVPLSPLQDNERRSIPSKLLSSTPHRGITESTLVPSEGVPSAIPQTMQRRVSTPLATPRRLPSIVPPPAVQALRIVKRAKVHHPKSESAGSVMPCPSNVASSMMEQERAHIFSVPSKRATAEGIPPASTRDSQAEPSLAQQPTTKSSIASSASSARTGHGPRRVPAADNSVGSTAIKVNQTSLPLSTLGPRRVPINNTSSTVILSKSSLITTGLRQPTRLESGQSATSSLPKPSGRVASTSMSRLPAPMTGQLGTSKLRKPTGGLPRRILSGE
ncbi:hypothetical protein AX15_001625 [Amanita polypyramis BW_CC]|nr:hypothetical protein AX15_001625 [Amanita polypyramis BW_CC]